MFYVYMPGMFECQRDLGMKSQESENSLTKLFSPVLLKTFECHLNCHK
jgi:hypothetical protein